MCYLSGLPTSSMASDYSYVKLCMTDLMINNSGGAEVALSCRPFYLNICVCVGGGPPCFGLLFIIDLKNLELHLFCVCGWTEGSLWLPCLSSKACRMSKSMLHNTDLFVVLK